MVRRRSRVQFSQGARGVGLAHPIVCLRDHEILLNAEVTNIAVLGAVAQLVRALDS